MDTSSNSFQRYLAAKQTVDDRALNRVVWNRLAAAVQTLRERPQPLRVLEVGAGIGVMLERLFDWRLFGDGASTQRIELTAIDERSDNIAAASSRLWAWARERCYLVQDVGSSLCLQAPGLEATVRLLSADILDFAAQPLQMGAWDLLIGQAVLDLLPLSTALPHLLNLLRPGGLCYFPITFDGGTILEPEIELELDAAIEAAYHRTADGRVLRGVSSGDSRCGRHLYHQLRALGARVLALGASDWAVFPSDGRYPADEAYFLHFIINTIAEALDDAPGLNAERFQSWVRSRHEQIDRGALLYIAHQLDVLGQTTTETRGTA